MRPKPSNIRGYPSKLVYNLSFSLKFYEFKMSSSDSSHTDMVNKRKKRALIHGRKMKRIKLFFLDACTQLKLQK